MTTTRPQRWRESAGMTLVELCVVIVVMGILMVLGTAALLRARVASFESNAIASLRTINKAEIAYAADCGNGHYATTLTLLAKPPRGGAQGYIADDIGYADIVTRHGYIVTLMEGAMADMTSVDCHNIPTHTAYYASAAPVEPGSTGNRAFATSQAGSVWQTNDGVPPPEPFGAPATILAQ
jgi:prepilin-type N-terminal cleavage/methylation domain-containing protein